MKTGNFSKVLRVGLLIWMLPLTSVARKSSLLEFDIRAHLPAYGIAPTDSIPIVKRQDDKDKKKQSEKERTQEPKNDPKTVGTDAKRPNIKEVPKSRPKLRPGVVDRVKVKRPPIKKGGHR